MKDLQISNEVYKIVQTVCEKKGVKNFDITHLSGNDKGEGFLGEICFITLKDKDTKKELNFVVKKSFSDEAIRSAHPIRFTFLNEIYFYKKIWPKLNQVQSGVSEPFRAIPQMLTVSEDDCAEMLVMENLKKLGYEVFNKRDNLDSQHVKKIFTYYGKFHALSFAMKKLNSEEYFQLANGIIDMYLKFLESPFMGDILDATSDFMLKMINQDEYPKVYEYFSKIAANTTKIFTENLQYKGKNSVILHGDCWSNNMMFKYNELRELIDIQLIDFQLTRIGTPVYDLSYCLYAGASSDVYNNLETYLKIYYDSFSQHYKKIVDEEPPYTFDEFKSEWIQYNKFGFLMALMIRKIKSTNKEDILDVTDLKNVTDTQDFVNVPCDTEFLDKQIQPLIKHLYKLDTVGF